MSTAQGAYGESNEGRTFSRDDWKNATWRRGSGSAGRWTPFELIAMVLGFIVFWPIGLAILGYKFWQSKSGAADLQTVATGAWRHARAAMGGMGASAPRAWTSSPWTRGFTPSTGNRAFDDWKSAELARLEAERRKLEDAHREFAEWLDTVRKAKDREEFERFMADRRKGSA
jgi:hypothetical protein